VITENLNKMTKLLENQFKFDLTKKMDSKTIEAESKKWEQDTLFIIRQIRHELDNIECRCVSSTIDTVST
jgi:hypothetical protein